MQREVVDTLQAPTPTFDTHIEFEASLQMEGATAGAVVDVPVTVGEDQERTENEEVSDWLKNQVGLEVYVHNFWESGYGSLDIIRDITGKDDLEEIGITDPQHQMHILGHIHKLNAVAQTI